MPELPSTIAEAAEWLRGGRITSAALTEALLARSEAAQESIAAFNVITPESARAAATQADADFARGVDRGPLQGVPLAVKDLIATADAPTTAHSRVLDPAWGQCGDATVIRKLREAGAVLTGKLGLYEFAIGWPDPATGFRIPKNPWDLGRTPGGSSSGTGAAVAAGLILGGLGTDTGGSVRSPASYCGISGLKVSFGRVSKQGCVPLGYSLDSIGPMARTARDCALMLQAMVGYDPADPCSVDAPVSDYAAALNGAASGLRVGVPRDFYFSHPELDQETKAAVLAAIDQLRAAGATVAEVPLPHAAEAFVAARITMWVEAYAYHEPDMQTRPELYGKHTRRVFQQAAFFTGGDYVQAQRVRSLVRAECDAAMANVDVLLLPTSNAPANTFADHTDTPPDSVSFTNIWNLVGYPALSVPCGFTAGGLPIGLQIVGRPFDEATVLRAGDAYQQLTDWHTRTPSAAQEAQAV